MEPRFGFNADDRKVSPRCDFCCRAYSDDPDVQIDLYGLEICPTCFLKGPAAVAALARKRPGLRGFVPELEKITSFTALRGGRTALAIVLASQKGRRHQKGEYAAGKEGLVLESAVLSSIDGANP